MACIDQGVCDAIDSLHTDITAQHAETVLYLTQIDDHIQNEIGFLIFIALWIIFRWLWTFFREVTQF